MRGFVSDHDIEGHFLRLMELAQRSQLSEIWESLLLENYTFAELGWSIRSTDRAVWLGCQEVGLILVTNNRNREDETSLQATIGALADAESLPVITIGSVGRFENERGYASLVADELIQLAFDVRHFGRWLGSGRVYLPHES